MTGKTIDQKIFNSSETLPTTKNSTITAGIQFASRTTRNPHLIVSGSSYDRGLEHLLKMWPEVKKQVPDAQLRVFYGWHLFDIGYRDNPERMAWREKMNKLMEQDGITHLGRISHEAVQKEFENAGIWAYPTHFGEISCITAMKAQAFGAIPVVVSYAALEETVQFGEKIDGDIYDQETKDAFLKALVGLLNDPERQEKIRKEMVPWAREKFLWSSVAKQWDQEFKGESSLEKQVEELMEDNQALKAWDLVKDTTSPLKERVWLRVRHAFDPQAYKDYYSKELTENPVPEELALDCTRLAPRFAYVVPKILALKPHGVIDLGCADGYLGLTLAKASNNKILCQGVNLHFPSAKRANEIADKYSLSTAVDTGDLFDEHDHYDCAVMLEVLEHLPDPQKGVDHAMRLLNDGGHAFFSTPRTDHVGVLQHKAEPNHAGWDDGKPSGHLRLFTEEEFKDLFKKYKIVDFHVDEERCMIAEVTK